MIKTTNKDLSCKVMEAGITLDTMFGWYESKIVAGVFSVQVNAHVSHMDNLNFICPAPTACEWLEVMPDCEVYKEGVNYICATKGVLVSSNEILSDSLAMMAIWLVEQGLWVKH